MWVEGRATPTTQGYRAGIGWDFHMFVEVFMGRRRVSASERWARCSWDKVGVEWKERSSLLLIPPSPSPTLLGAPTPLALSSLQDFAGVSIPLWAAGSLPIPLFAPWSLPLTMISLVLAGHWARLNSALILCLTTTTTMTTTIGHLFVFQLFEGINTNSS